MNSLRMLWNTWLRWTGGNSWLALARARVNPFENALLEGQVDFSDETAMLDRDPDDSTTGYNDKWLLCRHERRGISKWNRYGRAIVVTSACLFFLALCSLTPMFGPSRWSLSTIRIFGGSGRHKGDPDQFLIGAGKADITG